MFSCKENREKGYTFGATFILAFTSMVLGKIFSSLTMFGQRNNHNVVFRFRMDFFWLNHAVSLIRSVYSVIAVACCIESFCKKSKAK